VVRACVRGKCTSPLGRRPAARHRHRPSRLRPEHWQPTRARGTAGTAYPVSPPECQCQRRMPVPAGLRGEDHKRFDPPWSSKVQQPDRTPSTPCDRYRPLTCVNDLHRPPWP